MINKTEFIYCLVTKPSGITVHSNIIIYLKVTIFSDLIFYCFKFWKGVGDLDLDDTILPATAACDTLTS